MKCPKCQSSNIRKNGHAKNGKSMIKCSDCGRFSTVGKLPKLSTLTCKKCGKLGVNSRDSMLCINCYARGNPSKYTYKARLRKTLSKEEQIYFRKHLDELPARLNMTLKQQVYFNENPDELDRQIKELLY